jgi:hypothetical protein
VRAIRSAVAFRTASAFADFSALAARRTERFRGDLAAEGKGEWIVCR